MTQEKVNKLAEELEYSKTVEFNLGENKVVIDESIRFEDSYIISVLDKNEEPIDGMRNEGSAEDAILEVLEWSL